MSPEALRDRRNDPASTEEQRRRSAFARSYLRKLINLWVNVPVPSEDSLLNMVAPKPPEHRKPTLLEQLKKLKFSHLKWAALVGLMVLLAIGSFERGKWLAGITADLQRFLQPDLATNAVAIATAQKDNETNNLATAMSSNSPAVRSPEGLVITNHSAQRDVWNREKTSDRWWLVLPALFGVVIIVRAFTWSRDLQFQDKPDFRQALQIWGPVVGSIASSPRERKRFVNRVRYLAMRQRGETSPIQFWKQLISKLLRKPNETKHVDQDHGHEAQLVGLDVSMLVKQAKKRLSPEDAKSVDSLLEKAEKEHVEAFHRLPFESEQKQYKRVVAEVEFT
jgi:hypothetical protein